MSSMSVTKTTPATMSTDLQIDPEVETTLTTEAIAMRIFKEKEALLTNSNALPFSKKIKLELMNNCILKKEEIDTLKDNTSVDLLPKITLADGSSIILFMSELISTNHTWGKRVLKLVTNLTQKRVYQFKTELNNVVCNILSDINDNVAYSHLFKINVVNLTQFVRDFEKKKYKLFDKGMIISSLFQAVFSDLFSS